MNNEIKTDLKLTIPIKSVSNEIKENKDKLIHYLSEVLSDYVTKYNSSGYRIFGIEYGKVLNDNSLNTSDFKRFLYEAKKPDSYDVEIHKGKNIYEYLYIEKALD